MSLMFGVALAFVDFFLKAFALFFIGLIIVVFICVWLVDLLTKTSRWKSVFPFLFVACSTFIISIVTYKINDTIKKRTATKLVKELYEYRRINNHFPQTLSQINRKVNRYAYFPDSLLTEFELSYSIDGWNINTFNSPDSIWVYHD